MLFILIIHSFDISSFLWLFEYLLLFLAWKNQKALVMVILVEDKRNTDQVAIKGSDHSGRLQQ